ncbi:unnamed protein product [Periconia digitata]|uniref:Zn(2)-C6 fungal-type domain-containing protein n=1 Tax=Periconia digitata TaxID=1303443 RepID=A0A9W4UKW2_9PLEO|nr:unnamed protein product [Periconia digitata]
MSGYYNQNPNLPPQYYNVNPNFVPNSNIPHAQPQLHTMAPDGSYGQPIPESPIYRSMPGAFVQYPEVPLQQQPYIGQYEDTPGPPMDNAQNNNARVRRRSGPGDQVKHRRTRSGCYTCRQRRVKCDENRPQCERCRKGNRDCVYPDSQPGQKGGKGGSKSGKSSSGEGSSPEEHDEDAKDRLPPIPDEEDYSDLEFDPKGHDDNEASSTPALTLDRSPTPSVESSLKTPNLANRPPLPRKDSVPISKSSTWSKSIAHLSKDLQFYLNYFKSDISHHHYALKMDTGNVFQTELLRYALKYDPLLYAVVGYAAYFHTLSQPDGQISTFLRYYNESVTRLRVSITKSKKQGLATFLTILQLAAIEEVLGDWVNLMGHQKAAYDMLVRRYSPETIVQSNFLLKIVLWYIRFDLFVGFQSGGEAVLSREWYVAVHERYMQRKAENPDSLQLRYEERFAYTRVIAKDVHDLFLRKGRGQMSDEETMQQFAVMDGKLRNLDENIDPELMDTNKKIKRLQGNPDPNGIFNGSEPNVIWGGEYYMSNFVLLDLYGILFMYHLSISMAMRKPFEPDMVQKAYQTAQMFEALCQLPNAPPGAIFEAQATIAIAMLFLPKDPTTRDWCRRSFVKIESSGYIYPAILRTQLLETWGMAASDWWFPNDEGCPRMIRSIKDFIRERTTEPKDQVSQDLREMRGIFSTLNMSDSPPGDGGSNASNSSHTPIEGTMSFRSTPGAADETEIYTGPGE